MNLENQPLISDSQNMTRCIAFAGLKGVGKTTQTLSVAYCASNEYDKKVLAIDLDPQSSSSIILGITPNNYDAPVAYGSLTEEQFNAEIERAMEDVEEGRVYSAKEVEEEIFKIISSL
mgnify:CR=1 FL=1